MNPKRQEYYDKYLSLFESQIRTNLLGLMGVRHIVIKVFPTKGNIVTRKDDLFVIILYDYAMLVMDKLNGNIDAMENFIRSLFKAEGLHNEADLHIKFLSNNIK